MKKILFSICFLSCFCLSIYAQEKDSIVYTPVLLVQADSMSVNSGQLITLPHQGLFIVDGNTFYSLDKEKCPDIEKFRVLENIPFEQVIVNDNELVVKSQQFLMSLGEENTEILAEFDTEDFSIFSGNDSIINIVTIEDNDSCVWYKFDRRTGDTECIMRQIEPIKKIVAGNHIDFCLIGNNIYYVNDNNCGELVVSEKPVIDMILLPKGLMFCTDDMLSFICDDGVVPIVEGDFHGLLNDGNAVYVILKNGNIWKLSTINP